MEKNNLICKEQHGYRKEHLTSTACHEFITHVKEKVDNKQKVATIFFDQSAAFDVIPNDILIEKLENLGVKGPAQQWLKCFLENRKLKINNTLLDKKCNTTGVS